MTIPFMLSIEETLKEFKTRKDGLRTPEIATIKATVGLNTIPKPKRSFYERYLKSTINIMIIILFLAAVAQILLGETFNGVAVLAILVINTLIAMIQQFRTERTLEALERISSFKATVLRDGQPQKIEAYELVPGDILILKQGDHISADARLIEASELSIDESILTGESVPVNKDTEIIQEKLATIQQQKNMVFNSTFVTSGNAKVCRDCHRPQYLRLEKFLKELQRWKNEKFPFENKWVI